MGEVNGILSVAVKCVDIEKNTIGEDGLLFQYWRSGTKAWGANRIRYPGSPCSKRCQLGVGGFDFLCAVANALSWPPGEYGRKVKTQRNWRGPAQAVEHVVQFDATRRTLPGLDMYLTRCESTSPARADTQVLHGCRQLVLWDVGLSPATSATLTSSY